MRCFGGDGNDVDAAGVCDADSEIFGEEHPAGLGGEGREFGGGAPEVDLAECGDIEGHRVEGSVEAGVSVSVVGGGGGAPRVLGDEGVHEVEDDLGADGLFCSQFGEGRGATAIGKDEAAPVVDVGAGEVVNGARDCATRRV